MDTVYNNGDKMTTHFSLNKTMVSKQRKYQKKFVSKLSNRRSGDLENDIRCERVVHRQNFIFYVSDSYR